MKQFKIIEGGRIPGPGKNPETTPEFTAAQFMIRALARTIVDAGLCSPDEMAETMRSTAARAYLMRSTIPTPRHADEAEAIAHLIWETFPQQGSA